MKRGRGKKARNLAKDETILGARIREARERAGFTTPGQLWKAIGARGGNVTRQYLYQLENGKSTASLKKLTPILDACGLTMSEFLGADLTIGPKADAGTEQRKLVTMLTKIRAVNPALARVVESAVAAAHSEALQQEKGRSEKPFAFRDASGRFRPS